MSQNIIVAKVLEGQFCNQRVRIRWGEDQRDGKWQIMEVEVMGKWLTFDLARQIINAPAAD